MMGIQVIYGGRSKVRQIPQVDNFFENVWREFRMNGG